IEWRTTDGDLRVRDERPLAHQAVLEDSVQQHARNPDTGHVPGGDQPVPAAHDRQHEHEGVPHHSVAQPADCGEDSVDPPSAAAAIECVTEPQFHSVKTPKNQYVRCAHQTACSTRQGYRPFDTTRTTSKPAASNAVTMSYMDSARSRRCIRVAWRT